ncbi:MAG: PH domain-containing protein [Thermomicrobiales bacterium]
MSNEEPNLTHSGSHLRTLDPRAIAAWRVTSLFAALFGVAIWLGILVVVTRASENDFVPIGALLLAAGVGSAVTAVWLGPPFEWKHWGYGIREDEIEIHAGIYDRRRTLIPMSRVQFVDFQQGPIDRHFGLATITIHTAGGSRDIPGIAAGEAEPLRNRIAALANIHDDL